ncbi:MAG: hypothetical protein PVI13_04090 [Desulfobacterales bacterium]|jgi:hypothetical protein
MDKRVIWIAANLIILISFFMLGRVWCKVASGVLVQQYFGTSPESWVQNVYALGLSLPVPLHIISVGLVLQLRWLSPRWARGTRWAVVISGCWLGLALAIRWLAL